MLPISLHTKAPHIPKRICAALFLCNFCQSPVYDTVKIHSYAIIYKETSEQAFCKGANISFGFDVDGNGKTDFVDDMLYLDITSGGGGKNSGKNSGCSVVIAIIVTVIILIYLFSQ